MNNTSNTFGLLDLARAFGTALRHAPQILSGAVQLAWASPHHTGSIGLTLEHQAAKRPQQPFLLFEDRSWTYAAFNAWVNQLARVFKAQGLKPGDCVALMYDNRPELLAAALAATKLGALAGMLNHHQRGEVLAHSLGLVDPKLIVVSEECRLALEEALAHTSCRAPMLWDGEGPRPTGYTSLRELIVREPAHNLSETQSITLGQRCYYVFTSGTTGLPKASAMSHLRWRKSAVAFGQLAMRLHPDDVLYCPLPLYHNNALTVAVSSVMYAGATLALARKFSATGFWPDIRRHSASAFIYVGELCRYLLKYRPSEQDRQHRLRVIVGNGLRPEIWDEFQQRFGIEHICEFYAASECNLAFVNAFNFKRTAGYCPLPYAVVAFDGEAEAPMRDAAGHLQKVTRGGTGLLLSEVTESAPFDGYTDAQATEAKLLRNVFEPGDVWFNTGDLVQDQGLRHVAFVDRVGDTFRWKGENVATTEVEGVLQRWPGVAEAVVYGVSVPDAEGRAGMAALSWQPEVAFDGQALYAYLREHLPTYAIPLFIRLRHQADVTTTFKYRKVDLKQQGYDPALVGEPLYGLLDRGQGYEELTAPRYTQVQRGAVVF